MAERINEQAIALGRSLNRLKSNPDFETFLSEIYIPQITKSRDLVLEYRRIVDGTQVDLPRCQAQYRVLQDILDEMEDLIERGLDEIKKKQRVEEAALAALGSDSGQSHD